MRSIKRKRGRSVGWGDRCSLFNGADAPTRWWSILNPAHDVVDYRSVSFWMAGWGVESLNDGVVDGAMRNVRVEELQACKWCQNRMTHRGRIAHLLESSAAG